MPFTSNNRDTAEQNNSNATSIHPTLPPSPFRPNFTQKKKSSGGRIWWAIEGTVHNVARPVWSYVPVVGGLVVRCVPKQILHPVDRREQRAANDNKITFSQLSPPSTSSTNNRTLDYVVPPPQARQAAPPKALPTATVIATAVGVHHTHCSDRDEKASAFEPVKK